jgi:hypothetical protein
MFGLVETEENSRLHVTDCIIAEPLQSVPIACVYTRVSDDIIQIQCCRLSRTKNMGDGLVPETSGAGQNNQGSCRSATLTTQPVPSSSPTTASLTFLLK